jgi:hypothetical protein
MLFEMQKVELKTLKADRKILVHRVLEKVKVDYSNFSQII